MKSTDSASLFPVLIGASAGTDYIREVPATQATSGDGSASIAAGYPPETFNSTSAGGKYADGRDQNGFLNLLSSAVQQLQARGFTTWDSDFATAIGGYPEYAVVQYGGAFYISTADANTTTPGASGATWKDYLYSAALTGTPTTPTATAGADTTQIANAAFVANAISDLAPLTSPHFSGTPTAPGVTTWSGTQLVNAASIQSMVATTLTPLTSSTSLTAPPWATRIEVWVFAGGGGGCACDAGSSGTTVSGGGGGSGGISIGTYNVTSGETVAFTVGAAGAASGTGGTSSVSVAGTVVASASGGGGSSWASSQRSAGGDPGSGTVGTLLIRGGYGGDGQTATTYWPGNGAASYWGGGGRAGASGGVSGVAYGSGGGGAYDLTLSATSYAAGSGAQGIILYRFLP